MPESQNYTALQETLPITLAKAKQELDQITKIHELEHIKAKYIGKTGEISCAMQQLRIVPIEQKKDFGAFVNSIKIKFEEYWASKKEYILEQELYNKLNSENVDVTLNGRGSPLGTLHPISLSLNHMLDIFNQLGFNVADGPEIETDYYNFLALNFPPNHPARAMQDTFYTTQNNILRTHTSPIQVRFAENNHPPIKLLAPGRVYRIDMDASHSPMFHQLEGLWIDKNISLANLKAILIQFLRRFFENDDLQVRFRASFFPFTEPSAEIDIMNAEGRWLEVAGCGMVHPNVLTNMKIDPELYSGFAFGLGIDRFTMLRYGINDLRQLFENDLDFLTQFRGAI
ncbi:MAG: phenylalanine--tRNA ligase subunit alpha [Burkholderiales bacterium]|nr:phenylalanine--tRNA ligase subunit alpha [Burkholderiales bacterium]